MDDRWIVGGQYLSSTAFGKRETTVGLQTRYDDIDVGLFNTVRGEPTSVVREDHVQAFSAGVIAENTIRRAIGSLSARG